MAKLVGVIAMMALLVIGTYTFPGKRIRRGFNNSGYGGGYGRDSDERDQSQEGNGCSSENDRNYSGSRELAFNREGRQSNEYNRGSRSFTKATASAAATSYGENRNTRNF